MKPKISAHSCDRMDCPVCAPKKQVGFSQSVESLRQQVLELVSSKPEKAATILEQWLKPKSKK